MSIASDAFRLTSGMHGDEMAYKQQVQALSAAMNELQYDPQQKKYVPMANSNKEQNYMFNQAQNEEFKMLQAELEKQRQELASLQNRQVAQTQSNALYDSVKTGNYNRLNQLIGEDPRTKQMFNSLGVQSVQALDFGNTSHLQALRQSGLEPQVVNNLTERAKALMAQGKDWREDNELRTISVAWPVAQGVDNSLSITSFPDFAASIRLDKQLDSQEKANDINSFIARAMQAKQGVTSQMVTNSEQAGINTNKANVMLNEDKERFLNENPDKYLYDYKNANSYIPAAIRNDVYTNDKITSIMTEGGGVQDLWEVDTDKLTGTNRVNFARMAQEDSKNIKPEEMNAMFTISAAADKLNAKNLSTITGVVDATVTSALDALGVDLTDEKLVQSSNYNLIRNSIVRAAFGTQVTGGELTALKKQLGDEFKGDATVRVKMAETLDNIAAKYEGYKHSAPAYYAAVMAKRVEQLKAVASDLRGNDAKSDTKTFADGEYKKNKNGTYTKVDKQSESSNVISVGSIVDGYRFKGGDYRDENNWEMVNEN